MGPQPGVLGALTDLNLMFQKKCYINTDERWSTNMKSKTCEQLSRLFVTPLICVLGSFHTWGIGTLDYKVPFI